MVKGHLFGCGQHLFSNPNSWGGGGGFCKLWGTVCHVFSCGIDGVVLFPFLYLYSVNCLRVLLNICLLFFPGQLRLTHKGSLLISLYSLSVLPVTAGAVLAAIYHPTCSECDLLSHCARICTLCIYDCLRFMLYSCSLMSMHTEIQL